MNNSIRLLAVVGFLFTLSSCTLMGFNKEPELGDWAFQGKMAVQNKNEASSFNISWLQQNEYYQIEISGPFGIGAMTVKGEPGLVTLIQGETIIYSESLSGLLYDTTAVDLPLDHLQYWVRALPKPGEAFNKKTNDAKQITELLQAGWTVSIPSYFEPPNAMPRKLNFARSDESGKLVIREWSILPSSP